MTNEEFLDALKKSFATYLEVGTSRSTAKLKSLHGTIANDLQTLFGEEYKIKSQGLGDDKEGSIEGRYYPKNVDITVSKDGKAVAGYAIKFVVRNYLQNSNNYFENMLGETANIRAAQIPYFQIFIIFEKVPYYENGGNFKKYDEVTERNLTKYLNLSQDSPTLFPHVPDKTLIVILHLKETPENFANAASYADFYKAKIAEEDLLSYSTKMVDNFSDGVILNDYAKFIDKTYKIADGKTK